MLPLHIIRIDLGPIIGRFWKYSLNGLGPKSKYNNYYIRSLCVEIMVRARGHCESAPGLLQNRGLRYALGSGRLRQVASVAGSGSGLLPVFTQRASVPWEPALLGGLPALTVLFGGMALRANLTR